MRTPAPGSEPVAADERTMMNVLPLFFGRTKLPVNVAPAWRRMVSPGTALFSAACRSPPALTVMVAAFAADPRVIESADASRT